MTTVLENPTDHPTADDHEENDVLDGMVIDDRDMPALLPDWMRTREIALATAEVRARRAIHMSMYYGIRSPRYAGRVVKRGPVGFARAGRSLFDWIRHAQTEPLRIKAINDGDIKSYALMRAYQKEHMQVRGWVTAATAAAASIGLAIQAVYAPGTIWADATLAWLMAAWHGSPAGEESPLIERPEMPVSLNLSAEHLNRAFRAVGVLKGKDDDEDPPQLVMIQWPMRDSFRSWSAIVELPKGTGKSAQDVINKRVQLAAELGIDEIQLDIKRVRTRRGEQGNAARLAIWICDDDPYLQDSPTLSPLIKMDSFDVFEDAVPFGRDARSMRVSIQTIWQSIFFGGLPRRGKTAAQRIVVAAGVLDWRVRHWIADGKGGVDWRPMKRLAHRYVLGAEEHAIRAFELMLDEAIREMESIYATMNNIPEEMIPDGKVTPELLRLYNLQLNWITVDELQEYLTAISDNKRREELVDRLCRIARRGPAAGYFLDWASQRPDAESVPTRLREIMSLRYCTQVVDRASSDMVLGKGKAAQGADASILHEEHVGVGVLVTGPASHLTVVADYITLPQFKAICELGRQMRIDHDVLTGDATDDRLSGELDKVIPQVLADVLEIMRHAERMHTIDLLNLLVNHSKKIYGDWTADRLADELSRAGVRRNTTQVKIDGVNRNGYHKSDLEAAAMRYGRRTLGLKKSPGGA